MTRPISPTEIRCKDGRVFSVQRLGGGITVHADFRDPAVVASGLGRFPTFHEPGDGSAEHTGMPVEILRAYAKAHGGVAEAGAEALALLKGLSSAAAEPAPAPEQPAPAVEEAAPGRPFLLGSRGGRGGPPAADVGALDLHVGEPAPASLPLDDLTPAVIEARKAIAEFDRGFLFQGREPAHNGEVLSTWYTRAARGAGIGSRLIVATHDRLARHPLRAEALALRERLLAVADEARRELPAAQRRSNGIRVP